MTRNERNNGTKFRHNRDFPMEAQLIPEVRSVIPFVPLWLKSNPESDCDYDPKTALPRTTDLPRLRIQQRLDREPDYRQVPTLRLAYQDRR